jgi:hypothetical protein
VVRRSALLTDACALAVGLALLTGCGGGDLDSDIDESVDEVQRLEDEVDELELAFVTSTTAVPPPATLAPAPPTTQDPNRPAATTTTETTPPPDLADASEAAIRALVGVASWDTGLPVPDPCVADASFTPTGDAGIGGGTLSCAFGAPIQSVEAYYRSVLRRDGFAFSVDGGGPSGFAIDIGGQATIVGRPDGDGTTLTIEQRFS